MTHDELRTIEAHFLAGTITHREIQRLIGEIDTLRYRTTCAAMVLDGRAHNLHEAHRAYSEAVGR